MKKTKIYAYVSAEHCAPIRAYKPGTVVDEVPVSKHGDFLPWYYGKRATLLLINDSASAYMRQAARKVAWALGWL